MIIVLAAAIRAHALWVGFAMDDYAQLAMLAGTYPVERHAWDLFSFCDGSPDEISRLVGTGAFPWWTDPELRLSTLRPLASLLMWVDVRVFGLDARLHHAHTFVWWAVMLVVVARLLLRVLPVRWALLAFALYALDECHAQPLAWLANRNAILATTFGIAAVDAHVRWREGDSARWRWMACALLAIALSCGESALAAVGFVLAYEITRGDRRGVVAALGPVVAVLAAWAALHGALGYGASFSGIYLDPIAEPLQWAAAAVERAPILWADLAFALPTGRLALGGRGLGAQQALGVVAVIGAAWWLRVASAAFERSRLHWFAVAAVLSVVPMLSAFVSARLLVMPAVAGHVLIAACLLDGMRAWKVWRVGAQLRVVVAMLLAGAHLGLAPWWSMREISDTGGFAAAAYRASTTMRLDDAALAGQRVVVLAAADPSTLLYPPFIRSAAGMSRPRHWSVLSAASGRHQLRRIDARTLELRVDDGMLHGHVEQMFRRRPVPPQRAIAWGDAQVEVVEVDAVGFPLRVRFTFATTLEDPSLVFVLATPAGFVRYPMGPIGAVLPLPPASAPLEADVARALR